MILMCFSENILQSVLKAKLLIFNRLVYAIGFLCEDMKGVFSTELEEINQLIIMSKYQEASKRLDKLLKMNELLEEEIIEANILKARIHLDIQPFSEALLYSQQAYEKSKEINNPILIFDSGLRYMKSLSYLGFQEKAEEIKSNIINTLEVYEDKDSTDFIRRKPLLLTLKTSKDIDEELVILDQAIQISENIGDNYRKAWLIFQKAGVYKRKGDYPQSEKCYLKGINIFIEIGHILGILVCSVNHAAIYIQTGELDKYLSLTMKNLAYAEELDASYALGGIYGDLGFYYWQKGELDTSIQYYEKSLKQIKRGKLYGHHHYSTILFRLNLVYLELNKFEEVERNLEKMEIVATFRSLQNLNLKLNPLMYIFKLSHSIYLKRKSIEENYESIKAILNELVQEKWLFLEYHRMSLFHLCDLYLKRIKETNDSSLLQSITQLLEQLEDLAELQRSSILKAEILLLQSNMALIDLEIEDAKVMLEKAQAIADEKGITRLATLISNEYDYLLEQMNSWQSFTSKLPNIADRLELTHLEDMMNKLMKDKSSYANIPHEEEDPSIFLIMDGNGHVLFSDNFEDIPVELDITQGIISTIHDFLEEKHELNQIHRLRFENYSVVLHQGDSLILCYVFVGKSYSAIQKFKQLIKDYISFSDIWQKLKNKIETKEELNLNDRNSLSDYLESIFV